MNLNHMDMRQVIFYMCCGHLARADDGLFSTCNDGLFFGDCGYGSNNFFMKLDHKVLVQVIVFIKMDHMVVIQVVVFLKTDHCCYSNSCYARIWKNCIG